MMIRKPLATALAALALAPGGAAADASHKEEIHVESFSWGSAAPPAPVRSGTVTAVLPTPLDGPALMPGSATGRHIPHGSRVSSYHAGGSANSNPPMPGQGNLSVSPGSTRMFNAFANFSDIKGESTSGASVQRALPVQQLPPPSAPQRPPVANGSSTTLLPHVRSGALPAAAGIKR